jgi:hypothetical protein
MFEAKVYKVMIGCPGDSMEELLVAKKVIAQWNEQNAEREGKLLYPIEGDASECNLQDVDIVIGIIGTRIVDTELIEKSIKAGKHVILFFRTFNDDRSYLSLDLENLDAFKNDKDVYEFLNTGKRSFEKMLNSIRVQEKLVRNKYEIKKKTFEISIKSTEFNEDMLGRKVSNIEEFFYVIDW